MAWANQDRTILLTKVEKIKPNQTNAAQAEEILGKPGLIKPLGASGQTAWLYLAGKYKATKLSLILKDSRVVSVFFL